MKLSLLAALLTMTLTGSALADCDYPHPLAVNHPECVVLASDLECEAEYLSDAECQAKADRLTVQCVAEDTCREAAQGWLEDDGVTGADLGTMYGACLDFVSAAGGVE